MNPTAAVATLVLFLVIGSAVCYKYNRNNDVSNTNTNSGKGEESTYESVTAVEEEEYNVCEEHGHDFREYINDGLGTDFVEPETGYPVETGIHKRAVPGRYLGVFYLLQMKTAPCRDCPVEDSTSSVIERRVVFHKDGEVKSIAYSQYEQLEEEIYADE